MVVADGSERRAMNEFIDNVIDRPLAHKLGAVALILVLIGLLFWQYVYSAPYQEVENLTQRVERLNADIVNEQRIVRDLPRLREVVRQLDIKLKQALTELPDRREIPALLSSISNLARDAGLEVSLFKPLPESLRDFYAEVPVSIVVVGTFHQVATFFDEVGRLSRIVNISEIGLKEPRLNQKERQTVVKTNCKATTFRYLDESERQRVADENSQNGSGNVRRR